LTYPHRKTIINLGVSALKKLLKVAKPKKFEISGVVGFDDPSHTGLFIGAYEAIAGALMVRQNVRLAGDFSAEGIVFKIDAFAKGRANMARLAWPVLWFALQKPVRGLIWGMLKG